MLACSEDSNSPSQASGGATSAGGSGGSSATGGSGAVTSTGGSSGANATGGSTAGGGASSGGSGGSSASGGSGGASAGSGGDAGSGGGSSGGGGRDFGSERDAFFGAPRCDSATDLTLCEDFEAAAIDTGTWSVEASSSNTVELDTTEAARGNQSLRITANNGFGFVRVSNIFPMPNNVYWARMFLRVARYSSVDWAHWTVAEAAGAGDGSLIRVGGQYVTNLQRNRWGVGSDGGPTGDWTNHDQDPNGMPEEPPLNQWTCLEWLHDGASDVTRFFVDAMEHPSLATTADDHGGSNAPYVMPEFESVWFGWWQYQADPMAFDVFVDEIAVDDERIGCKL